MIYLLTIFLWQTSLAPPTTSVLNLEINPSQRRAPIEFAVSWQRPTLVVFNRVPDGKIINGDTENWFIGAPPQTPDHTFHFKPKTEAPGMLANSFLFFDGYPVELVYRAVADPSLARSLVYITVAAPLSAKKQVLNLASKAPEFKMLPARSAKLTETVSFYGETRIRNLAYGRLSWTLGTKAPSVYFQPRAHMAGLESVEVVRAHKRWFGGIRQAQPLTKNFSRVKDGFRVDFELVHLTKREHYYLRLFFKGSKRPVYVRLRGYRGL